MLKKRKLGCTGLEVSELALGGLFISSYGTDRDSAGAIIRRAWELGINYIDTAPGYLDSEAVLGEALSGMDADFIISTKLGYQPEPYQPKDPEFLRQALAKSLERLRRDSVDILMIHEPDRPEIMDWWEDGRQYRGPVMGVLEEARETGKADYIGLGGTTAYEMAHVIKTGSFQVLLTAFQYSLLWREAEHAVLPAAIDHGMGIICGSPLQQGALAKLYRDEIKNGAGWLSPPRQKQFGCLYQLVQDTGIELPELALRFILSNTSVTSVLTGARSVEELEKNVAASAKGPLPEDVLKELDTIAAMVPFRPYLEPFALPFGSAS